MGFHGWVQPGSENEKGWSGITVPALFLITLGPQRTCVNFNYSKCDQHVTRALDGLGDAALLLGGEMRVFTRENLACICDVAVHQLGLGKWELLGSQTALGGGFGGAHLLKKV